MIHSQCCLIVHPFSVLPTFYLQDLLEAVQISRTKEANQHQVSYHFNVFFFIILVKRAIPGAYVIGLLLYVVIECWMLACSYLGPAG